MNKNLLYTLLAVFLLTGSVSLQAAEPSALLNTVKRTIAEKALHFADDRLQQMCHEWPTCEDWVTVKVEQDPSFQIIDAEVEHWFFKWENDKAVWAYRFYVQTKENNQTKAYMFTRGIKGFSYNAPVLIKNFPGHPFPGKPTRHVSTNYPTVSILREEWPGYHAWSWGQFLRKASTSQRIYKWDKQNNAVWEKSLYVEVGPSRRKAQAFVFRAYQTKAGGDFTFESPVEISAYPAETQVSF
ncbi:MAG: hypothetical protein MJ053_02405 [Elusimicrobiaceae bacterium]|nr:hypothetical protein [Elusimicrobiaceae bacterium]